MRQWPATDLQFWLYLVTSMGSEPNGRRVPEKSISIIIYNRLSHTDVRQQTEIQTILVHRNNMDAGGDIVDERQVTSRSSRASTARKSPKFGG